MTKIAIFQHEAAEPPGLILTVLRRQGHEVSLLHPANDRLPAQLPAEYQGLVLMGGPMAVYEVEGTPWLQREVELVRDALQRRLPVLGVCLGAQILAAAGGAQVYAGQNGKEIGWEPIRLTDQGRADPLCRFFSTMPQRHLAEEDTIVFQWHGDTFDLPSGAELLASSERYPQQAFRLGKLAYGLQFHFEVNENHIKQWLSLWKQDAESAGVDFFAVRAAMQQHLGLLNRRGEELVRAFGHLVSANAGQIVPPEPPPPEQLEAEAAEKVPARDTRLNPLTPAEQEQQAAAAAQEQTKSSFVANRPSKKKPRKVAKRLALPPAVGPTAFSTPAVLEEAELAEAESAEAQPLEPQPLDPEAVTEAQTELQAHADAAMDEVSDAEAAAGETPDSEGAEPDAEAKPRRHEADLSTFVL